MQSLEGLKPIPGFRPKFTPRPRRKFRVWTRSQALHILAECEGPHVFNGWANGRKMTLKHLKKLMVRLGYKEFHLVKDPNS